MSIPRTTSRRAHARRILVAAAALSTAGLTLGGPASAHVTVDPSEAEQGGFATLAFQVPNETEDANTTQVEVTFPAETPIAFVSVKPTPGWTFETATTELTEPVDAEGGEITEAVSTITWQGGSIAPGEFEQFVVSAGPLPEAETVEFPTVQTYDDGDVVRWIEPTPASGEEPEFPAPTLTLAPASDEGPAEAEETPTTAATTAPTTAATSTTSATPSVAAAAVSKDDVDDAKTLGTVGIAVGAVGILAAIGAVVLSRRRPA